MSTAGALATRRAQACAALLTILLVALLAGSLHAHGGTYGAPSAGGHPMPPPDAGGPSSSAPAPPSGHAPHAGSSAGRAGGTAPVDGSTSNPPTTAARGSVTTGGPAVDVASAGWQYWWELNKDRYLNLKSRAVRLSSQGVIAGHLTGRGRHTDPELFLRPHATLVRGQVLPWFIQLLDQERVPDVLDSSMLALSRSSGEDTAQFVIDAILPFLAHKDRVIQRAAALSLGVLRSPRAVSPLTELVLDSGKGRGLAGGAAACDPSLRACAALALGLIDEPDSVGVLCSLIERTPDAEADLKVCAIAALGLMDNESSPQALSFLVRLLGERGLDPLVMSHVPVSIGRLCERLGLVDPVVEHALLEAFGDRSTDDRVRQSLAIALGLVGTVPTDELEHDAALTALLDECATGRSDATREFSFIALAEVGARDGAAPQHPRVHQALRDRLIRECVEPTVASDRAWAALGAAIYGRQQPDARPGLAESLVAAWSTERDPSYKGAFALALGLIGADTRAGELFGDWQDHQDQELNGFTALALGFMGYRPASEPLRELCQSRTITSLYRMRLATALALLADDGTDEALIGLIGEGHAVGVTAAAAKALGLVGGEPALAALRAIAGDKRQPVLARAFACVAVGMICEKTDLPWNARLAADCNFRQLVPTLREALEIL